MYGNKMVIGGIFYMYMAIRKYAAMCRNVLLVLFHNVLGWYGIFGNREEEQWQSPN